MLPVFNNIFRAALLLTALVTCNVQASMTLQQMFLLALQHDPTLQAAVQSRLAQEKEKDIGRAGLLPQVGMSYKNSPFNRQTHEYESTNIIGQSTGMKRDRTAYKSSGLTVSVTQPLFDYEAWAKYKGSVTESLMAEEQYRIKYQELITRLITAYIEVARLYDYQQLTAGEVAACQEQLAMNKKMSSLGEGTITDVAETLARYRMAQAQQLDNDKALEEATNNLSDIVGVPASQLTPATLSAGRFPVLSLNYASLDRWLEQGMNTSPEIRAARYRSERARFDIEAARGGHLPKMELYAAHTQNDSMTETSLGQKYATNSIGLQVSMPLYNGGGTSARVGKAHARYKQSTYELTAEANRISSEIRKNFNLCRNSAERIGAYELALDAAKDALEATRRSVSAGARINLDVLNADRQRLTAAKELAQARYDYLKAWTALLNASGMVTEADMAKVSSLFVSQPG